MLTWVVPNIRASLLLSVDTGNQKSPFFWYCCTKCTLCVQNDGLRAGLPSARTNA